MKHASKLMLLAGLTPLLSNAAMADDSTVTIYGRIHADIENTLAGAAGAASTISMNKVANDLSRIGFKGSEDLGGGLKAGFALTGGFDSANGSQDVSNAAGAFFGREAKVTLGGSWGTVGAGLQFDPALISMIGTEPRGLADSFSNLQPVVVATLGNGAKAGTLTGGAFNENSLTYTYSANGLYAGLSHELGGQANSSAYSGNSVGLSYTNSGFTGSLGYAGFNGATGATSSQYTVGGLGYAWGDYAVRGQYGDFKSGYSAGVPATNVTSWGIGMDWKTNAANKLNLSYYKMKDTGSAANGGGTTMLALLDTYQLSKRTTLFGQIASVNADANPGMTDLQIYAPGLATAAGGHTTVLGLGINHSF